MRIVKVVILNWNGREHLRTFLPSVIATTPAEIGIVVADNGSTDDSVMMLKRDFPEVEVLELRENHGYAGGYNRAVEQLDADYYILLNSDVETTEGWCTPLVAALDSDPKLIAVQPKLRSYAHRSHFEYAGASGGFIDFLGYPFCRGRIMSTTEEDMGQYDSPRRCFWASGACLACRREIFTEIGGLDEDFFAHMEEIDMCWRAQLYGYKVAVEPRSTVYHLGGGTLPVNSPQKIYLNYRNNLAMLYKNLPQGRVEAVMLARMIMDGLSAVVFVLQGHTDFVSKIWSAHIDFHRWRKKLKAKRTEIISKTVSQPYGIYKGAIVLRYYLGRKQFDNMM